MAKTKISNIIASLDDPEMRPHPDQLTSRPLSPMPFTPERGKDKEADGAALTKVGRTFRETVAAHQGVDPADVPVGMVRLFEALNADSDRNLAGLARPVARRTELGLLWTVQVVVNTALLMAWLINGRALRRLARAVDGSATVVTSAQDHDELSLPVMRVEDADQVVTLVEAQRELLQLHEYKAGSEQSQLIESVAAYGVLEPPDVVLAELVSDEGSAWTAQTAEGARRLFASHMALDLLAGRDVSQLLLQHWFDRTDGLRDLTAADVDRLTESLTFPDSLAAGHFPGKDPRTWIETTAAEQPAAVAWQLLRTMTVNLVIAVEPNERARGIHEHPVAATIQELIRSFHVTGKAKKQWDQADVDGLAAITITDRFREQGRIDLPQRGNWLGQGKLSWDSPLDGLGPDANKLVETAQLLGALTVQSALPDPDGTDSLAQVDQVLRENSVRRHPNERARVGAAQAIVVMDLPNSGHENQVASALKSTFRDPLFWKADEHPAGPWTDHLTRPLAELAEAALFELDALGDGADAVAHAGPSQRALGALGIVALIANPALVASDDSITSTGRGGGGRDRISAADPSKLVAKMVMDPRGIAQLREAVAGLVGVRHPVVPADPDDHEPLTERRLRTEWLGEKAKLPESPQARYLTMLRDMVDTQVGQVAVAEMLTIATEDSLVNGTDPEDGDDVLYEILGISEDLADRARDALRTLDEFFNTGKAIGRAASRPGRA